jgi:hypothetical protein
VAPLFVTLTRSKGERIDVNLAAVFSLREEVRPQPGRDEPQRVTLVESPDGGCYATVRETIEQIRGLEEKARQVRADQLYETLRCALEDGRR